MLGEHAVFDILAWLSALLATWLVYRWRFRHRLDDLAPRLGTGYFAALSLGGLAGSFGFGTLNALLSGQPGIGRSILGGLVGAILLVELYKLNRGIRGSTGALFAAPVALAIALGRIGCFRAGMGDFTYGVPTTLPWGIDFGDGISRHPVQLYETASMLVVAGTVLAGLQRRLSFVYENGFYLVTAAYGIQRFAWEFLKPYATPFGPLNLFHLLCLILVVYAAFMIRRGQRERP